MKLIKFLKSVGADLLESTIFPILIWSLAMTVTYFTISAIGFISSLCGFVLNSEGQPEYFATGLLYALGLFILAILFFMCKDATKYIKDKWNKS